MRMTRALYSGVAAVALALALSGPPTQLHGAGADRRRRDRQRRHRRRRHGTEGSGSRRLGDRGNARPAHPLRQDGGHGRPGPLRRARPAEGQVQSLGSRLRPGRLREGRCAARPAVEPARRGGAERRRGGAVLSRDLLVLDAEDSAAERLRRVERHSSQGHVHRLDEQHEEQRLRRLSSARPAFDAHIAGRHRQHSSNSVEAWVRRVSSGQSGEQMVNAAGRPARRRAVQILRATGPTASPRASCRTPSRRGRRASSATSSSRPGTGGREAVSARPDRVRPAVPDSQCVRQAVRLARILDRRLADPRSGDAHGDLFQGAGARPSGTGMALGPGHAASDRQVAPSPYWGTELVWDTQTNNHNAHVRPPRPGLVRGARTRQPRTRTSARRARTIRRPRRSRWRRRTGSSRCWIRRR